MSDTQHSDADDLSHQPPERRAAHYRELADRHLAFARQTKAPEAQAAHLELAALWTRLAGEADRQAHAPDPAPEADAQAGVPEDGSKSSA